MRGTCSHCGQVVEHTCLWCGEPAVAFCDEWIGGETVMYEGTPRYTLDLPQFTCDAPMCHEHRKVFGFVCGKEPDTMDRCPVHQRGAVTLDTAAKSKEEAETMRRAVWAEGRRECIRRRSDRVSGERSE